MTSEIILPLEIINKIQSELEIVSLIYFGQTCKRLYQVQKPYLAFKEKEISNVYFERIRNDLEEKRLLDLLEKFLPQFQSAITGFYLDHYIKYDNAECFSFIRIEMPNFMNFGECLNYIHENIDSKIYIPIPHFNKISICLKENSNISLVVIIHTKKENVYDFSKDSGKCTDLNKIYCKNFWQVFGSICTSK